MMKNYLPSVEFSPLQVNKFKYLFLIFLVCLFSSAKETDKTNEKNIEVLAPGDIGPIEVSGFNHDVIANGVGAMSSSTTIELDDDTFCLLSSDWKESASDPSITVGLPSNGEIVSSSVTGLTYKFSPMSTPYDGNNSLRLSGVTDGTLTVNTPLAYEKIYILVTSGSNASNLDIKLKFSDNSEQSFTGFSVPDWFQTGSLPVEASGFGRGDVSNNNVETPAGNPKLFRIELQVSQANQVKNLSEITFEKKNSGTSVLNVFAVSGKESDPCPTPTNLTISGIDDTSAHASWIEQGSASEWEIIYGVSGFDIQTSGQTIIDNDGTLGELITGLQPNTPYDAYVRAICSGINSNWSAVKSFTTLAPPCAKPSNIVVSNVLDTSADVSWTENGTATEWTVLYGLPGFDPNTQGSSKLDDDGSLGVTLDNLTPDTSYDVYVYANCSQNDSELSEMQSFTTEDLSLKRNEFLNFSFYPNPASEKIKLNSNKKIDHMIIYNLAGKKVLELYNLNSNEISLAKISSGIYFMRLEIEGARKVYRLIKE